MVSRLFYAVLRAAIIIILIALPGLLIPGMSADSTQFAVLMGLFMAALVLVEYTSDSPIVIEFRDAKPYNRIRIIALFIMVFLLSTLIRGTHVYTPLASVLYAFGDMIGGVLDFPYSPIRLIILMLPDTTPLATVELVRAAAGIALACGLATLAAFVVVIRVLGWPERRASFNMFTNLPLFDPTAGGDVVERLTNAARVNFIFGLLLPFMIPACIKGSGQFIDPLIFENPQTVVWLVVLWGFLPANLCMRGLAMHRLVSLVERKRRQRYEETALEHTSLA